MRLLLRSGFACFVFLCAVWIAATPVAAQCPPDSVCQNCPTDTTAKAGQMITVPLFSVGRASTGLWLWVDCQSVGACWSDIHTHNGSLLEVEPHETNPVNNDVRWEFHDEAIVKWDYTTESEASAPLWITQEMNDYLETEAGTATKEYKITNAGSVLQMIANPTASPIHCERSMTLSETLTLARGGHDEDGLLNMAGAGLRLQNNGTDQVRLKLTIRDEAPAAGGMGGSEDFMVQPAAGWARGRPDLTSFKSPFDNDGRAVLSRRARRPLDQVQIRLDPGEAWNGILPAANVYIEIQNQGPGEAVIEKTISMERVDEMAPGSSQHFACIQAGAMTDNISIVGEGGLEHVAATARAVRELPQGVMIAGANEGFENVIHDAEVPNYTTNVRYIRVGNKVWCWATQHWSGTLHLHYNPGTFLNFNAQVMIPATAQPGDTQMIWYRYTVMVGGMTIVDSCHVNIHVVACAPSEHEAKAVDPEITGPRLQQNVPNPFRTSTVIRYGLERGGPVELDIFSVDGRAVRRLVNDVVAAGQYEAAWDGRDDSGRTVAGGIYFYRLLTPDGRTTRRMLFVQ